MPEDYSTPILPAPAPEPGWVPGDLPEEQVSAVSGQPSAVSEEPSADSHPPSAISEEPPLEPIEVPDLSLEARVESLLFVAEGAVPLARLVEALEVTPRAVETALAALAEMYAGRGLSLQRYRDKAQLTTAPAAAAAVERFLGLAATTALSKAALEALAIIAYQQPVTRPQIDSVRGVNSDSVIKNLLTKGLIEELGHTEGPGRPTLYGTTPEFLQHFGLTALTDLPPLNFGAQPALPTEEHPGTILKG